MTPRVLVVDDDAGVRFTVRSVLEDAGMDVVEATDGADALARLDDQVHLVVTDFRMPGMDGRALLAAVQQRAHAPPVILITAHGDERLAVAAMKAGAYDYLAKPFDIDELLAVAERAVESVRLRADNRRLTEMVSLSRSMVFRSDAMQRLATLVARVGPRDVTVLVTGESGTGKERIAEAIVAASSRADRPFVRFNCASLGADLAEAELFGHAKGAFTGAVRKRTGLFREADGGTLLLDEVGELAPEVQARLLRVLQSGEVRPVGEDRAVAVDVRLLAATHRDLAAEVAAGRFRQDLYYRLKVVQLTVPPLRARPDDIPLLARHFLDAFARRFGVSVRVPEGFDDALAALPWTGNVRELENTLEMLVALSDGGALDLGLLPDTPAATPALTLKQRIDAYERGVIVQALEAAHGNKTEAARQLGIGRVTLYEKIERLGIVSGPSRG